MEIAARSNAGLTDRVQFTALLTIDPARQVPVDARPDTTQQLQDTYYPCDTIDDPDIGVKSRIRTRQCALGEALNAGIEILSMTQLLSDKMQNLLTVNGIQMGAYRNFRSVSCSHGICVLPSDILYETCSTLLLELLVDSTTNTRAPPVHLRKVA